MSNNLKCDVCGTEYQCTTCKDFKTIDAWRLHADTPNCYKIYIIMNDACNKRITYKEAKELLLNCDLSEKDSFPIHVSSYLDEVLNS